MADSLCACASRRPLCVRALIATLGALLLAASFPAPVRADDEEWKARISKALNDVEMQLAVLDKKPPMPGSLAERAAMCNERTVKLESEAGLSPGSISGKATLPSLSSDAASLNTRVQKVMAARNAAKKPKPPQPAPPPDPKPDDPPPADKPGDAKKKDPKAWPTTLDFSIGARITYEETGSWIRVEV